MLLGFVYCFIYYLILKITERSFVEKIKQGLSVYSAIIYRKKIKYIRIAVFLFCVVGAIAMQYLINSDVEQHQIHNAFWPIIFMFYIMMRNNKKSPYANYSFLSLDDVINSNKEFILYLRGFERDNYLGKKQMSRTKHFKRFSEFHFFNCLRNELRYNFYAVGMTKEVEAPFGADRVYLEDYSWRNDIVKIMDKAAYIIVEINDKPSCVWEIEQCDDFHRKTIFLITDIDKYKRVYNQIIDRIPFVGKSFPSPDKVTSQLCFTVPKIGSFIRVEFSFENNLTSYKELSKKIAEVVK